MRTRLELDAALSDILVKLGIRDAEESGHLYFQPTESVYMLYPSIVYELKNIRIRHADNKPYKHNKLYTITAIDKDPDSRLPDEIALLQGVSFDRFFTSDNLNHWVFKIHD